MMTASSTASTTTPPPTLVMSGNGQPIIANGRAQAGEGGGGGGAGDQADLLAAGASNAATNSSSTTPHSTNGGARVKTLASNGLSPLTNNNSKNNWLGKRKTSASKSASLTSVDCAASLKESDSGLTVTTTTATHAKMGPSALKQPLDVVKFVLKHLFFFIIHMIVSLYTYLTLPIFMLMQNPGEVVEKANETRSQQLDANDPYSAWVPNLKSKYAYILDHVSTLDEIVCKLGDYFNLDRKALGYRRVIREHVVYGPDGVTPLRIDGRDVKKRELSDYQWIDYVEMIKRRAYMARGLHLAGIDRHTKIVILCDTCAEYLMVELAIANAGAVQVNVFSTLGEDGIAHAVKETQSRYIFTSFELLAKTRKIIESNKLDIAKVIYTARRCENPSEKEIEEGDKLVAPLGETVFVTLDEIEESGKLRGHEVEHRCKPLDKDEVAIIMYTSGTTGVPKGVQGTSYQFVQLLYNILPVLAHIMGIADQHVYVAYLPQAHIFEATCELLAIVLGAPLGFANPLTLTASAPGLAQGTPSDLTLLQPTIMIAVPLVLERMRKEIFAKLESRSPISAPLFNYLMDYKIRWTAKGYTTPIINKLFCTKIREQFGGKLEKVILGGAPLSASLQALIKAALNATLVQGYGMTETLGACLCMDDDDLSYGRCGAPLRGVYAKLDDFHEGNYQVTDKPHPRGELIIGSKANSLNYLDKPEMNAELYEYDADLDIRWFRTGDIAEVFPDGTFKIIDRKKDLVKLANGEYFSLGKIESILKNCSYIDNVCVFGNALANYLVALVVPNQNRLGKLGKSYRVPKTEWNTDARLNALVLKSIRETGLKNGLKKAEIPTKVCIVSDEWTPDNGLLTAAMKLKRSIIKTKYQSVIDELFTDPQSD